MSKISEFVASLSAAMICFSTVSLADSGGGALPAPMDSASEQIAAIHAEMERRADSWGLSLRQADSTGTAAAVGRFQYPLRSTSRDLGLQSTAISNHVDLDPTSGIKDFACGTRTYDGHNGTDIFLAPFTWTSMDRKEEQIVAALDGTIVEKQDGNFDRQCEWSGNPPANYVIIRHDNGLMGYYWHMKKGSVTTKAVGARVSTGEYLGYVGSSGFSTGPHLHFEVRGSNNAVIEPASGACNKRATSWTHQAATIDTQILDVMTHSAYPTFSRCSDPAPNIKTRFLRGETAYLVSYFRDQPAGASATVQLFDPKGALKLTWQTGSPSYGFYAWSYWWVSYQFPAKAQTGIWRIRTTIGKVSAERALSVVDTRPSATVSLTVADATRTISAGTAASFTVTVKNPTINAAIGCRLSLDRPILADVRSFGPGSSLANKVFSVPSNSSVKVRLAVTPRAGFTANQATFPVKATCSNAQTYDSNAVTGRLTLSSP